MIEPAPASHVQRVDYFGNAVDQFTILTPYKKMRVVGRSVVEVSRDRSRRRRLDRRVRRGKQVRDALFYQRGAPYDDDGGVQLPVTVYRHRPRSWRRLRASRSRRTGRWRRRRST